MRKSIFAVAGVSAFILTAALFLIQPHGTAAFDKAPSFAGTDLRGVSHSLEDYQGRPLVLYFWATWCPACRQDLPGVNELYGEMKEQGVEMVSISLDKDESRLREYVEEKSVAFPVIFGGGGWQNEIAEAYGIAATPSFVVIDDNGNIRSSGHWSSELEDALQDI